MTRLALLDAADFDKTADSDAISKPAAVLETSSSSDMVLHSYLRLVSDWGAICDAAGVEGDSSVAEIVHALQACGYRNPLNGSWLPIPEMERLRAIEHAARDVDGAWGSESEDDGSPILWYAEAGEVLADLRAALRDAP